MKIQDKYSVLVLLLLVLTTARAQVMVETPSAMFLEVASDARSTAMGGVMGVSESSAFSVFNNASATLFSAQNLGFGATLSARDNFKDMNLYSLGGFYNFGEKSGISVGLRYFDYPSIAITGGTTGGTTTVGSNKFKPKEMALNLGYGYKLTNNLSLSLTLQYINSDMGTHTGMKKADVFAASLGITYLAPLAVVEGASWSLGMAATNFGTKMKYDEKEYQLPSSLAGGTAVHLPFSAHHQLTGTLNVRYRALPSTFSTFEAGIGAEYNFYKYGFVRAGYHFGNDEKGLGNFTTLGAGVNIKPLKIDFAYHVGMPNEDFRHVAFVSLSAFF